MRSLFTTVERLAHRTRAFRASPKSASAHGFSNGALFGIAAVTALSISQPASASIFHGETLDTIANVLSWVVLFVVPIVGIVVFWLVHILPEKIAEKRKHPQAKAIQTLCLLSLFFGGLLWPLAWLWAYSKPVMYKLAYGTDTVEHEHGKEHASASAQKQEDEIQKLRGQVTQLQQQLNAASGSGKA
jgi:CBS domain containing-hemolysin-like protein